MRNFGECHGLRNLPKEKSAFCVHHSFEQCATDDEKCVGADQAEFVYKVVEKPPPVKPDGLLFRNAFITQNWNMIFFHIFNLFVLAAGLFKYVWPFRGHQVLKG